MTKPEKIARSLLDELGIKKPPVPVEKIAEMKGAILSFEPFEGQHDISGVLFRDEKNIIIGINSAHHQNRQRFTIAHELGHLLLHERKELFIDKVLNFRDSKSSLASNNSEMAANTFAAELLMPKELIKKELIKVSQKKSLPDKETLIKNLAKLFQVSPQAMEFRLINLGILFSH